MREALHLTLFTWEEVCLRVFLAMSFGFVLGWDRDSKNKPIDFRAYMIVCVATCLIAMATQELYADFANSENLLSLDLGKIMAGTLTGIGFLGAGAIIKRDDHQVIGTATGASIWAAGSIGLVLGFGIYPLAIIGFLSIASILIIGGYYMSIFQGKEDRIDIKNKH